MKAKDVRAKDTDELLAQLKVLKTELFRLRFQAATGQLDKPHRIREVRRDIARVHTILRERELAAQGGSGR
jgi:large subunit ribosomal protein L29